MSTPQPTLGIIAGGGRLPAQLAQSCKASGRPCFVLALEGFADLDMLEDTLHATVRIGAVGEAFEHLRKAGAKELVLAGTVRRPSLTALFPDATGAKLLKHIGTKLFAGDDKLLRSVIGFLEAEGFTVVGVNDVLARLIAPKGVLGKIIPSEQAQRDIAIGIKTLEALSPQDIGQAAIIANGKVMGTEDIEGTNALIARCNHSGGVLVKCKKADQEERVDLPTIGPETVKAAHAAGLQGIAIEADGGIIIDRETTIDLANTLGIFIVGISNG